MSSVLHTWFEMTKVPILKSHSICYNSGSQSVVTETEVVISCRNLLELHIFRLHLRPIEAVTLGVRPLLCILAFYLKFTTYHTLLPMSTRMQ